MTENSGQIPFSETPLEGVSDTASFYTSHQNKRPLKTVIVHDWLTANGGAEKVLKLLLSIFPGADVMTLVDTLPEDERQWLGATKVYSVDSFLLKQFPKKYRWFLPMMPFWIEQLDVSEYDLVISSSHAVAKGVICHPHQTHIAYIYSPMRYAWDLQFEHFKRGDFGRGLKLWLIKRWLHRFRIWDSVSFLRTQHLIATSGFIADRIQRVCGRKTPVIYPPVDSLKPQLNKELQSQIPEKNYYVIVSRMVPYKQVNKVVEAFRKMPDRTLVVIGDGPQRKPLEKEVSNNIIYKGYMEQPDMVAYIASAKAFIHMAIEDFGIAPLEAQSLGIPVIAFSRGALSETILDIRSSRTPTGVLFDEQTAESLQEAVDVFESQHLIDAVNCIKNAERFSTMRFQAEFLSVVNKALQDA